MDDKRSIAYVCELKGVAAPRRPHCLLYTSDAADDLIGVDLGGRRAVQNEKHMDAYHRVD